MAHEDHGGLISTLSTIQGSQTRQLMPYLAKRMEKSFYLPCLLHTTLIGRLSTNQYNKILCWGQSLKGLRQEKKCYLGSLLSIHSFFTRGGMSYLKPHLLFPFCYISTITHLWVGTWESIKPIPELQRNGFGKGCEIRLWSM